MRSSSWQPAGFTPDECIKCNICTTYCPVAGVTDLFPGPKNAGPQAQRFREGEQLRTADHSVDYCSGCRVCNEVCPSGVKIAEINARARAQIMARNGIPFRNRLLGRSELLGKAGMIAPRVANFGLKNGFGRFAAEKLLGIAKEAPLPGWSTEGTFGKWMERTKANRLRSENKVVYFHGCSTMYYEPFIGKAAVAVLEKQGFEVIVPPQNCCGLPMLSNGEFDAAEGYHRSNISKLLSYAQDGLDIVGTSTSCTLTLKEEAPELLDYHGEGANSIKLATWDIFEWLRELHLGDELDTEFIHMEMTLPYHAPCQYRAHRIGKPALEIMELIPELVIRDSQVRCCGIAGTYGYKVEKYQIAMDVGQELFDFINQAGSDVAITACDSETCRWQLEHGTGKPSRHPIEILAAAYGLYDLENRELIDG